MRTLKNRWPLIIVVALLVSGLNQTPAPADDVDIPGVFAIDSLLEVYPLGDEEAVRSEEVAWDSVSSMHLIQVRGAVLLHHHEHHSENIVIIRGAGRLTLDGKQYKVKAGEVIHVPKGTSHAFHNLGSVPAVAISVFSPGFDGKDRVYDTSPSR